MSTAIGHGLVGPKKRGKPVSLANKGRRVQKNEEKDRKMLKKFTFLKAKNDFFVIFCLKVFFFLFQLF